MPKNPYKQITNLSKSQKNRRLRVLQQASLASDTCAVPISVVSNTVAPDPDIEINHANAEFFNEFNIYCPSSSTSSSSTSSCNSSSSNDYFEDEYFNECSNTDSNLSTKLREWASEKYISANALTSLLHILTSSNPLDLITLPKDARTLMKTPKQPLISKKIGDSGEYVHFGLEIGLRKTFLKYSNSILKNVSSFKVFINFDGVPIYKSSGGSLWSISCSIFEIKHDPFIIGSYFGTKEPTNVEAYLEDFVKEASYLTINGLFINDRHMTFNIEGYICDAPARALVKCIKRHNAYFACEKCQVEGDHINNRMCFADVSAPRRTDIDFAAGVYDDHCREKSPLLLIPRAKLVTQFPLDYLHLICLGTIRKMLYLWIKGPLNVRLSGVVVKNISYQLIELQKHISSDFARKPRALSELCHWKGTEFRLFVLYIGPLVLKIC
ncbi:unnamed protein product [Macrosiphum euphorbiae]|uniref:Transposase domain-containing protein n=2 Tax=Macrosiphum euphorbiae TaxID=13131 RepID=A0AAV0Y1T7_9HEMI|nr:unnamed protein product [Macrosiphum euphorbiae]